MGQKTRASLSMNPEMGLPHRSRAGCPISRVLCEKWGFSRTPYQPSISAPANFLVHQATGNPWSPGRRFCRPQRDVMFWACLGAEVKNPTLRQAQGRLSRKEREKWGTLNARFGLTSFGIRARLRIIPGAGRSWFSAWAGLTHPMPAPESSGTSPATSPKTSSGTSPSWDGRHDDVD